MPTAGQSLLSFRPIRADIKALPFIKSDAGDSAVDITHMRFVLIHLGSYVNTALEETIRVTSEKILLLEYDWSTLNDPDCVLRFKRFFTEKIPPTIGMDLFWGARLDGIVSATNYNHRTKTYQEDPQVITTPNSLQISNLC